MSETNLVIQYQGSQISLYSDETHDYVNLTEMAVANGNRKYIKSWMNNKQTLLFLCAWESKNNPKFTGVEKMPSLLGGISKRELSIQEWTESTNAIGIFSRVRGAKPGTWAHKDVAIKFAGWLSPEFELYLIEELQRLKKIEHQKNSFELLNYDQILAIVRLKEVFKYVAHQVAAEEAHKQVYASKSPAENPFAEFNTWRNKILDIKKQTINDRIKQYCIDKNIALTSKISRLDKRDKILLLDSYESVKIAVWDFLQMKGEINALNLANLAGDMIRTEQGEVLLKNEDTLFEQKQDWVQTHFSKMIDEAPELKTARQILDWREKEIKRLKYEATPPKEISKQISTAIKSGQIGEPLSDYNKKLIHALNYNPKEDKAK